jgi:periodic tryptophan protein 1
MIAAVCWVPKGAAKNLPIVAEPPTEEEIRELLQQHESAHEGSEGEGEEEEEEGHLDGEAMEDAEAGGETPSVLATAIAAATALGATVRRHKSYEETLVDGLAELDMDRYDDEDEEGVEIFGNGGLGAAYYPSNEDEPYLVYKEDDD